MTTEEKLYRLRRALHKAQKAIDVLADSHEHQGMAMEAAELAEHCRAVLAATGGDEATPIGCPGYPGECPEGMDWGRWLAMNNVD